MKLNLTPTALCLALKQSASFREEFVKQASDTAINEERFRADYTALQKHSEEQDRRVRTLESYEHDVNYYKRQIEREQENRRSVERQLTAHQSSIRELENLRYQVSVLNAKINGEDDSRLTRHEGAPFFNTCPAEREQAIAIMRRVGQHNKIASIKEIRQFLSDARKGSGEIGLANAKYFVENSDNRKLAGYEEIPF